MKIGGGACLAQKLASHHPPNPYTHLAATSPSQALSLLSLVLPCPALRWPDAPSTRCSYRDQLADTVLTLLFAGHDTSSTTLVRIFQHLHAHPEAVTRLRQEQVLAGCLRVCAWWWRGRLQGRHAMQRCSCRPRASLSLTMPLFAAAAPYHRAQHFHLCSSLKRMSLTALPLIAHAPSLSHSLSRPLRPGCLA